MLHNWFIRPLWRKEIRQTWGLFALMPLLGFLAVLFMHMQQWWFQSPEYIGHNASIFDRDPMNAVNWAFSEKYAIFQFGLALICFLLALWQMGYERRNHISELGFALPYPRWLIYGTKWMVGAAYTISSVLVITLLYAAMLWASPIGSHFTIMDFIKYAFHDIFAVLSAYTLMLFIGSFTGSWTAQAVLTFILFCIYEFITSMVRKLIYVFFPAPIYQHMKLRGTVWENLNILSWITESINRYPYGFVGASALLLFVAGLVLYNRNPLENNGKLILFPAGEKVLIGIGVFCAALLGGDICYTLVYPGCLGYLLGAGFCIIVGYLSIRKLARMRL
ncbi:acetoin ABC transporter permease [Paenibacillus dendritiformis]|uniref:acetoin ABC transporter permease n=1 Tax=Paenibacillus dendritiformis TaxID=130049 RepID=UPI0018CF22B7|nr:acetoin ABC transporter permease [Paenibacillus dendritiformis]